MHPEVTNKSFPGTGKAEPAPVLIHPVKGDHVLALSDGAYNALGGAEKVARLLMTIKLKKAPPDIPHAMLDQVRNRMDDMTVVVTKF